MKKFATLLLALLATLSLGVVTACDSDKDSTGSVSSSDVSSSEASSSDNSSTDDSSKGDSSSSSSDDQNDSSVKDDPANDPYVLEWTLVSAPTCTTSGVKSRVENGETLTKAIPARGHDYKSETGLCVRCNESFVLPEQENISLERITLCTHTDEEIYDGLCNCKYYGRGEDYHRTELEEGFYTVEIPESGKLWLAFSVKSIGQYALYSINNPSGVEATRHNANFAVSNEESPIPSFTKGENFYSLVNCGSTYFNSQWRATYRLLGEPGDIIDIGFIRIADEAWAPQSIHAFVYPTEINGKTAPEGAEGTQPTDVPYNSDYFYDEKSGYYRLGTKDNPGDIIFAAITRNAKRLLGDISFATLIEKAEYGAALRMQNGYTADGDYKILEYIPFIMNCVNNNNPLNSAEDPDKNCYENFCNSDGLYPVTQELFDFLNLYARNNMLADENIDMETWQAQHSWLWLSACYYYRDTVFGSKDNPQIFTVGTTEFDITSLFFYGRLEDNSLYTITSETPDVYLGIGDEYFLAPFTVTVSAPITLEFSTEDGSPLQGVSVTITKATGVSNGLIDKDCKPTAITQLGEVTLSTVSVYHSNSIEYIAFYQYTPSETGTITLTLTSPLAEGVSLTINGVPLVAGETSVTAEVEANTPVIVYFSASSETSVKVTLS